MSDMREAFEEHHPLMGLVSWSDFDDCYTAMTDSGLDLAEERTLQFHAWRLAWNRWKNEAVGHLDEDGKGLYARITHDDVTRYRASVGDPVYLRPQSQKAQGDHPDDRAVDLFALAMKSKLAHARRKGRSGWDDPTQCSIESLASMLADHLHKDNYGNFLDIANFCMMLHQRGAGPEVLQQAQVEPAAYARMLDGVVDWDECCLFPDSGSGIDDLHEREDADEYDIVPLYAALPAPAAVPEVEQISRFIKIMSEIALDLDGGNDWDDDPIPDDLWQLYREATSKPNQTGPRNAD